ncbi:MAG: hypothetical protein JKY37_21250, partial [Nannocystaceae bacterium]|nr:hypothetical protein [Nannocystaceae bacterium]
SGHTKVGRTHLVLVAAVASLSPLSSGCDAPADVDVAVTVRSVTRDGVELEVKTKPGLFVSVTKSNEFGGMVFSGSEPKADAEGRATITIASTNPAGPWPFFVTAQPPPETSH